MPRFLAALVVGVLLPSHALAQTRTAADVERDVQVALARPVSPGSVALLLPHVARPEVVQRLIQAIQDPRPEVRAVAARIAFTTRHASLATALASAWDKETNDAAAAEIARALALIQGAPADARIAGRFSRFDSRTTSAWLMTVSRTRPADVWAQLAYLQPGGEAVGQALVDLVRAQPDAAATAFAALPKTPALAAVYRVFVGAVRPEKPLPSWPVLAPGLATPDTRGAVLQLLVKAEAAGQTLPAEASVALQVIDQGPAFAWLALYRELAGRGRTPPAPKHPQLDTILRIDRSTLPRGFLADPILARLDPEEVTAFRQLVGPAWVAFEMPSTSSGPVPTVDPVEEADGSVTRLARPLSALLMKDLQALMTCPPETGKVGVVDVTYRPSGQVRGVSMVDATWPDGCADVLAMTAALDVAPAHRAIDKARVDRLVIGLRPGDLTCDRSTAVAEAVPQMVGTRLTAPKKIRNVVPVYPPDMIKARVQGIVLAESLITTSGCVIDAVVTRRVHRALDVAALAAIGEWRYEPATHNGAVVPVIMTVTVNFSLR
jgi:TonB family protein